MGRMSKIATVVAGALLALPLLGADAGAATKKLVLYSAAGGEKLAVAGDAFDMVLGHHTTTESGPNPFRIETPSGTVTCQTSEGEPQGIAGTVKTNSQSIDKVELEQPQGLIGDSGQCSNTSPLGATAEVFVAPNFSTLYLNGARGKAEIKAATKTQPILIEISYPLPARCVYTATGLKGTLGFAPFSGNEQIVLTFSKSPVKVGKGSASGCAKTATVSATFGFQDRGEGGFGFGAFLFGRLV